MRNLMAMAVAAGLALTTAVWSQEDEDGQNGDPSEKREAQASPVEDPKSFEKILTGRFSGEQVRYQAKAFETHLKNKKNEAVASIFATSYTKDGLLDPSKRPVTFIFNGGPGSASLWLHMGVFGPKRIVVPSDGEPAGAPPYDIVNNEYSLLDVSDLVFIDPVGTGYSRAIGKGRSKNYWGVREDARSLAEFIRLYMTEYQRWNSPKYLAGESYGTTRAAALIHELMDGYNGIAVNGVILISSILDFQGANFKEGNDQPYISFLPTYAASAWYHDRLEDRPERLEDFLEEVRNFAINEYAPALMRGNRLSDGERDYIVETLALYTGLSETYIDRANLRVSAFRFMKEFLREEGKTVGRFDSRYTGDDYDDAGEFFDDDPSAYGINAAFVSSVNDYLTRELGVDFTREYRILPSDVGRGWNWSTDRGGWPSYVNVAPWLGEGMRENSDLRVFVASGYYDLATPFFATENTVANNGIEQDRVTLAYYEAGHMMYTHEPSLAKLARDVHEFILPNEAN